MKTQRKPRRGATAVELSVVMIPTIMFIMGIFEYGMLLLNLNVFNNAAREGCRYALVNNTSSTLTTDVTSVVTTRMAGRTTSFKNFSVSVSGTSGGVSTTLSDLRPGDTITVTLTGQYVFMKIMPFVPTPTLNCSSSVSMTCEGGS